MFAQPGADGASSEEDAEEIQLSDLSDIEEVLQGALSLQLMHTRGSTSASLNRASQLQLELPPDSSPFGTALACNVFAYVSPTSLRVSANEHGWLCMLLLCHCGGGLADSDVGEGDAAGSEFDSDIGERRAHASSASREHFTGMCR
jgi:hypothetical protein